jgi:homoserine dehydrogenase
VVVAFEAAVAGGIPIIKALREGLTANRIDWVAGIINGTTNFILSEMRAKGLDFGVVLKEAQRWVMPRPTRPSTSRAWTRRTRRPS